MNNILNNNVGINGENISGGQCKRLCFLRMLNFHKKGNLIILDEPFNGLHEDLINLILDFIKNNRDSSIILLIDHTNSSNIMNPFYISL
jgi:ABC-type bacteriocin/lantibiotic exporter with double-glycine peptidase domain